MGNGASMQIFHEGELEKDYNRVTGPEDATLFSLFQNGYMKLVDFLIQPDRNSYTISDLGPSIFTLDNMTIQRKDFTIITSLNNEDGKDRILECSYWSKQKDHVTPQDKRPVLVYLHCNTGSRKDVLSIRDRAIHLGFNILSFDFAGCGKSCPSFVTGGALESEDLVQLLLQVAVLEADTISCFYLWGHSLGAATALMAVSKHTENLDVRGMVCDGAYTSLENLAEDMMRQVQTDGVPAPLWILRTGFRVLRTAVEDKGQFKMSSVVPLDHAKKCTIPALFISGNADLYVPERHAVALSEVYGGRNEIIRFEGDHYGKRPAEVLEFGLDFLAAVQETFEKTEEMERMKL